MILVEKRTVSLMQISLREDMELVTIRAEAAGVDGLP